MIFLFLMMKFGLEENEIKKKKTKQKKTHNLFEFFLINTYHL